MSADFWKLISPDQMALRTYRCGVAAGQRLRLKSDLAIEDCTGVPTGKMHPAGEVWLVVTGNPAEPDVIWLREPNGNPHTWDSETLLDWFELEAE